MHCRQPDYAARRSMKRFLGRMMLWWTSEEQGDGMEASSKDAQSTEANAWGLPSPAMRKKGSTPGEISLLPSYQLYTSSSRTTLAIFRGRTGRCCSEAGPRKVTRQAGWESLSQQRIWSQLSSEPDPAAPSSSSPSLSFRPAPVPRFWSSKSQLCRCC